MFSELPDHLQPTASRLSRSLPRHSQEIAPPIPSDLLDRLTGRLEVLETQGPKSRFLATLVDFLKAPSFGLAATALLVIGLFSPTILNSEKSNEGFRGSRVVYATNSANVVLITEEPEIRQLLKKSGLFDMGSVIETSDPLFAASIPTAKLLVDVNGGAIVGYNTESREVIVDQLPADRSAFAERIALALGALH